MVKSKNYRLADSVSLRIVQIFQEAMLLGIDGADLLREIRLDLDEESGSLVLTDEYKAKVVEMHTKLLEQAAETQRRDLTIGVKD